MSSTRRPHRSLEGIPPASRSRPGVCWYFGTTRGCRRGNTCRFQHLPQVLNPSQTAAGPSELPQPRPRQPTVTPGSSNRRGRNRHVHGAGSRNPSASRPNTHLPSIEHHPASQALLGCSCSGVCICSRQHNPLPSIPVSIQRLRVEFISTACPSPLPLQPLPPPPPPLPDDCGICLEEPQIYGLLDSCPHVFCLSCIMSWRDSAPSSSWNLELGSQPITNCPICRTPSQCIVPSKKWLGGSTQAEKQRKAKLVSRFKDIDIAGWCQHCYSSESSQCPLGVSCVFRAHSRPSNPTLRNERVERMPIWETEATVPRFPAPPIYIQSATTDLPSGSYPIQIAATERSSLLSNRAVNLSGSVGLPSYYVPDEITNQESHTRTTFEVVLGCVIASIFVFIAIIVPLDMIFTVIVIAWICTKCCGCCGST